MKSEPGRAELGGNNNRYQMDEYREIEIEIEMLILLFQLQLKLQIRMIFYLLHAH